MEHMASKEQQAYEQKLFGDFIPPKIAKRLYDTITFSVKLACRCPDLKLDP